jgi:NTE family protein
VDRGVSPPVKRVNLALQGGGSHGAYSGGALDALLEDERIEIAGVSGASAGAINAVVFAAGLREGRIGARRKLGEFWLAVSQEGALPAIERPLFDAWMRAWKATFTPQGWVDAVSQVMSPYAFNPARNCSSPRPTCGPGRARFSVARY